MLKRNWRTIASLPGPHTSSAPATRLACRLVETAREVRTFFRHAQPPLAAIVDPRLLRDPAFVDELLQHAGKALLGDLQHLQQVRHPQARIAVDEVENAVMRPAQSELGKHRVRLPREVAIGKEQQLDDRDEAGVWRGRGCFLRPVAGRQAYAAQRLGIYVSHVDLFGLDC